MENYQMQSTNSPDEKAFGRYQLLGILGEGGMGRVYKAWDPLLKRVVALKVLNAKRFDDHRLQRFQLEAHATAQLNHPNIVRLYEIGCEQGTYYYTMAYIEGKSLTSLVGNIDIKTASQLLQKIAIALQYAHEQGVLHRDLKSGNIVVDARGEPYIVDFGLAKMRHSDYHLTQSGAVLGTPQYMSPEQALGKRRLIDTRSDIYALGVILFELLTGEFPFSGNSIGELLKKVAELPPPLPRWFNQEIPKSLEKICLMAMAKRREDRYATARELAEDLARFDEGEKVRAKNPYLFSRWKLARLLLVTGLTLLMVVGVWVFVRMASPITGPQVEKWLALKTKDRIQALQKQLAMEPASDSLRHQLIPLLVELERYQEANEQYAALEQNKIPLLVNMAMVRCYYDQRLFAKANSIIDRTLSSFPPGETAEAVLYQAMILYHQKQYSRAVVSFSEAEQRGIDSSHHANVLRYLGICYFHIATQAPISERERHFQKASEYLEQAAQRLPKMVSIQEYLAKSYIQNRGFRGDHKELASLNKECIEKARDRFSRCIELQPNKSAYHKLLGMMHYMLEDNEAAVTSFREARRLEPLDIDLLSLLVMALNEHRATWEHTRDDLTLSYFDKLRYIHPPDLRTDFFRIVEHRYQQGYLRQQFLIQQQHDLDPRNFLERLRHNEESSSRQKIYNTVLEGLLTLRYHPKLDDCFSDFLRENSPPISRETRQFIRQLQERIRETIQQESEAALYYQMARLYIHKDTQIYLRLRQDKEVIARLQKILQNSEKSLLQRYLAADTLVKLLHVSVLDEKRHSKDKIEAILSLCALRNAGFPLAKGQVDELYQEITTKNFLAKQNLEQQNFFQAIIAQHLSGPGKVVSLLDNREFAIIPLFAAASFAQSQLPKLRDKARQILIRYTEDKRPQWRAYAHYHLWSSFGLNKSWQIGAMTRDTFADFHHYSGIFAKALRDEESVKKIVLQFAIRADVSECLDEIETLALSPSASNTVRAMAIFALGMHNRMSIFEKIFRDEKQPHMVRIFAFAAPIMGSFSWTNSDKSLQGGSTIPKGIIVQKLLSVFMEIRKYSREAEIKDPAFRAVVYWLCILCGAPPMDYLSQEKDINLFSLFLLELRTPPLLGDFPNDERRDIAAKYLFDKNYRIRESAYITYTTHANDQERERMYSLAKKGKVGQPETKAIAIGLYSFLYFKTRFQESLIDRLQSKSGQEKYRSYIRNLASYYEELSKENPKQAQQTLQCLDRAVKLCPHPRFYYERAILHKVNKNFSQARRDLVHALAQNPHNLHYNLELLALDPLVDKARLLKVQKNLLDGFYTKEEIISLRDIIWEVYGSKNVRDLPEIHTQQILAGICLREPKSMNGYILMAKLLMERGKTAYAFDYLQYALQSRDSNRSEIQLQIISEFPHIPESEWRQFFDRVGEK